MNTKASVRVKKGIALSKIGFEAADYLKTNINDVTTYSWVVDKIDRGFGYDLTKFCKKWLTCPETCFAGTFGSLKNFAFAFFYSFLDYLDLYRDLTLVLILLHMTSKVLVRYFFYLKFIYSEKVTKFCEIFTLLLTTVHTVKSKVKISHNFVAFSEYMNFKNICSHNGFFF